MKTKTSHIRNSTKRSFRRCGTAAGLPIPRSSKFRSTSRSAKEGVVKVGISLVILLAPAGGASDSTKAQSFQIVDRLNHQDDFWSNMLVGDANHNHRQEIVLRSTPVNGGRSKFIFYDYDGTGYFDPVWSIDEPDGGLLAMGDIDGDGLTDLFIERDTGVVCNDELVRYEAYSPSGFPDHIVWTGQKAGNVIDFNATIPDVDGGVILEFVTSDNNLSCLPTTLKVFESAPNDQMNLIFTYVIGEDLLNLGTPLG